MRSLAFLDLARFRGPILGTPLNPRSMNALACYPQSRTMGQVAVRMSLGWRMKVFARKLPGCCNLITGALQSAELMRLASIAVLSKASPFCETADAPNYATLQRVPSIRVRNSLSGQQRIDPCSLPERQWARSAGQLPPTPRKSTGFGAEYRNPPWRATQSGRS